LLNSLWVDEKIWKESSEEAKSNPNRSFFSRRFGLMTTLFGLISGVMFFILDFRINGQKKQDEESLENRIKIDGKILKVVAGCIKKFKKKKFSVVFDDKLKLITIKSVRNKPHLVVLIRKEIAKLYERTSVKLFKLFSMPTEGGDLLIVRFEPNYKMLEKIEGEGEAELKLKDFLAELQRNLSQSFDLIDALIAEGTNLKNKFHQKLSPQSGKIIIEKDCRLEIASTQKVKIKTTRWGKHKIVDDENIQASFNLFINEALVQLQVELEKITPSLSAESVKKQNACVDAFLNSKTINQQAYDSSQAKRMKEAAKANAKEEVVRDREETQQAVLAARKVVYKSKQTYSARKVLINKLRISNLNSFYKLSDGQLSLHGLYFEFALTKIDSIKAEHGCSLNKLKSQIVANLDVEVDDSLYKVKYDGGIAITITVAVVGKEARKRLSVFTGMDQKRPVLGNTFSSANSPVVPS